MGILDDPASRTELECINAYLKDEQGCGDAGFEQAEIYAQIQGSHMMYRVEYSLHMIFAAAKNSACVRDVADTRLIERGIFIPGGLGMRMLHMKLLAKFSGTAMHGKACAKVRRSALSSSVQRCYNVLISSGGACKMPQILCTVVW